MANCDSLPDNLRNEWLKPFRDIIDHPTGRWSDFNQAHQLWEQLKDMTYWSMVICPADLPTEPDPFDYMAFP
jgi:hypothetical protein